MLTPTTHRFLDANALADELAAHVSQCLLDTLQYQTHATLAVSGGRSPIAFFRNLSERALPWHAIAVTLVDDRCVPNTHDDSNALLVRTHLLRDQAARARFFPPIDWSGDGIAPTPEALADQATHALSALGGADVVVLGMGADGHTASLFPQAPQLLRGMDLQAAKGYLAMSPQTAPHERISLNLAAILGASHVCVAIGGGAEKHAVYEQAQAVTSLTYPVSYVLRRSGTRPQVSVWLHD